MCVNACLCLCVSLPVVYNLMYVCEYESVVHISVYTSITFYFGNTNKKQTNNVEGVNGAMLV